MSRVHFDCRYRYADGFQLNSTFSAGDGVTALFGPSGAGKSTIFALIAGVLRPDSGTIRLKDRIIVDTAARLCLPPERRQIGVVFQDHLLFPHLTVKQNLTFGRRVGARPIDFSRLIEILELGALLDRWPQTLSGGQRQRVALGRALLRGPELLLMDEPLTAIEQELKDRVLNFLERAFAEWKTPTLFVSHDQADVRRLAENVIVVEAGKVIDSGPTAATLDRVLLTRHPHRPALINLLHIQNLHAVENHWAGHVGEQTLHLPASVEPRAGGNVYVQFLPHDIVLAVQSISGLSVRNALHGTVREIVALSDRTFVALDVGQFLWAEVTPEAVRELQIHPGQSLMCLIKSTAIRLVS